MKTIETLIEKWLTKTVKIARKRNNNYVNKNKYTVLDFVLYRYFNCYIILCQFLHNSKKVQMFSRDFYCKYIEKAVYRFDMNNSDAEKFFWNRMEQYNKIMTSEKEKREENLVLCYEQFIAKSLGETPYEERIVLVGMFEKLAIMKELHSLNAEAIKATTNELKMIYTYYA